MEVKLSDLWDSSLFIYCPNFKFEIHTHEAIIQPTKRANLDTALTSQLQTSNSFELIKHNTVTICKQLMLSCMRSQHLNTCTLY